VGLESPLIVPVGQWAETMDRALQQSLEAAFRSHQAGHLDEAERHYRKALKRDPLNPDGLHLLGLLHHQRGRPAEAEELIAKAIRRRPDVAYYENLAAVQRSQGALERAVETCRAGFARTASPRLAAILLDVLLDLGAAAEALAVLDDLERREPPTADRLADRAFCLARLGRAQEAANAAERALAIDRANGNALAVLAEIASERGRHAEAVDLWRRALAGRPDWTAARINLGIALVSAGEPDAALDALRSIALPADPGLAAKLLNGLSAANQAIGQLGAAGRSLEAAIALAPAVAEVLSNLSELRRRESAVDALQLARRAIAVDASAGAYSNRGLAEEALDRLDEAVTSIRRSIALSPSEAVLLNNLGGPLRWLGSFQDGQEMHRRATASDPSFAPAWYGLGTLQLTLGDLARGWSNYDWRTRSSLIQDSRPFGLPPWQGTSQPDGTILVWGEQGLGDEIVYGSMLPELARAGLRAVVECDRRMVSLFERALPGLSFVARSTPPDPRLARGGITAQIPMGSLARVYRARLEDFPESGAYLVPRADLLDRWRKRLAALGTGPKIGFAWRTRHLDGVARRFHPPMLEWAPVLSQRDATFVSLQYGEMDDDIRRFEGELGATLHGFPDLDLTNDLENVLALSAALDMTISTATTAFCFPAAAGVPVWLLTPEHDFWMFGTDRYPWFGSVRVFVYRRANPWSKPIGAIADSLAAWMRERL
jgi:tetratricopeptide (TPR) repeat protein